MKYICLGYIEPGKFEGMTEDERQATFDDCFEYNDHLRTNGHFVAEVPLQPPETAVTLYWKNGIPRDETGHDEKHERKNDPYHGHNYVGAGKLHRFPFDLCG